MNQKRWNIFQRQTKLSDEAIEKLKESFDSISQILGSNGVAHKQLKMEIDEEQVAAMIAESMNDALGDATPENVMDVARGIAGKLAEMFMVSAEEMAEEEMALDSESPAMTEAEAKELAAFREKQYQQQEKLHTLLDQLITESVDDAEVLEALTGSYKALEERIGTIDKLVEAIKALDENVKGIRRQIALRPRASTSQATLVNDDQISEEVRTEMKNADKVFDEVLGLWLKKEQ